MSTTLSTRRRLGVLTALALLGVGAAYTVLAPTVSEHRLTLDPGAPRLSVDVGRGRVLLTHADGDRIEVRRTLRQGWQAPAVTEQAGADGARITADCPITWGPCDVAYDIAVPAGFAVDLRASSGRIDVRDVSVTSLVTQAASGHTSLTDVDTATVDTATGSGAVTGTGLRAAEIAVRAGSGRTDLDLAVAPGQVSVMADSGSTTLRLPGAPYRVDARSGTGAVRVDVPTDPTAPRSAVVTARTGDVALLTLPCPADPSRDRS